jgi:hypothetical protein
MANAKKKAPRPGARGSMRPNPATEEAPAAARPTQLSNVRLYLDQFDALKAVALQRKRARPTDYPGHPDGSRVLRELLEAIRSGQPVPDDVRQALGQAAPSSAS